MNGDKEGVLNERRNSILGQRKLHVTSANANFGLLHNRFGDLTTTIRLLDTGRRRCLRARGTCYVCSSLAS